MDRSSCFQGCLLGLAIGDALGMPFEFMTPEQIDWKLQGDFDFHPAYTEISGQLRAGQWTDDTKMALAIVESLMERRALDPAHVAAKFLAWYRSGDHRGIGTTTAYALERMDRGIPWTEAGRTGDSACGNGAAMRIAPVGLWFVQNPDGLRAAVDRVTISTHNHPEAVRAATAVAYAVARAAAGTLNLATILDETREFIGPCRTAEKLRQVGDLWKSGTFWLAALEKIGTGGYVVDSVGAAFYCLLMEGYERGVKAAVRAGGDTDTTAAIAGAMIGAYVGLPSIPDRWLERVEDGPRIAELGRQLCGIVYASA
jgi:ADP-ribosylglycohydrolase